MKLSNINITNPLTDEQIQKIVYSDIEDNNNNTIYGIVFGNYMLIKERVNAAYNAYKNNRIKKIIFSGGNGGISNTNNETIPEAIKMKQYAIELGIKEEDIIIEDKSNDTFENIKYSLELIPKEYTNTIALITSEFHLKRCKAIINKQYPNTKVIMIPAKDGYTDKDNWYNNETGRNQLISESNFLIKFAKEGTIEDLEINNY